MEFLVTKKPRQSPLTYYSCKRQKKWHGNPDKNTLSSFLVSITPTKNRPLITFLKLVEESHFTLKLPVIWIKTTNYWPCASPTELIVMDFLSQFRWLGEISRIISRFLPHFWFRVFFTSQHFPLLLKWWMNEGSHLIFHNSSSHFFFQSYISHLAPHKQVAKTREIALRQGKNPSLFPRVLGSSMHPCLACWFLAPLDWVSKYRESCWLFEGCVRFFLSPYQNGKPIASSFWRPTEVNDVMNLDMRRGDEI